LVAIYSKVVNQNIAWLFKLAGLSIQSERINEAFDLINDYTNLLVNGDFSHHRISVNSNRMIFEGWEMGGIVESGTYPRWVWAPNYPYVWEGLLLDTPPPSKAYFNQTIQLPYAKNITLKFYVKRWYTPCTINVSIVNGSTSILLDTIDTSVISTGYRDFGSFAYNITRWMGQKITIKFEHECDKWGWSISVFPLVEIRASNYIIPPIANFTFEPLYPTTGTTVYFNSTSTDADGYIDSWLWNFGDGNISYEQNPTHQYACDGTYNVTLTVVDNDGATNTTSKQITIFPIQYTLTTSVDPSGSGSISLNPSGGTYDEGTVVTITANPNAGYEFDHWSGDASGTNPTINITMNENKSIIAYFVPVQYTFVNITPCYKVVNKSETKTFSIEITVDPADGVAVAGVQCDLLFNASLLEVVSVEKGDLFNGHQTYFMPGNIDNINGKITGIADAALDGQATDKGSFAIITFKVKGNQGISYLNLTNVIVGDVNAQNVPIKINNGTVEIKTCPYDLNGDGSVNILDMIIVAMHWLETPDDPNWNPKADINHDNVINVLDLILVGQHFGSCG